MRRSSPSIALAAVLASALSSQGADSQMAEHAYAAAFNRLTTGAEDTKLEDVYSLAVRLGNLLSRSSEFESMSDGHFRALRERLPGFILNRDEFVTARPEPSWFLDLARRHGRPVDRAFFALLASTYPNGIWPVYVRQQTDYSGCTLFGQGGLVASYRGWRAFAAEFPRDYAPFVNRALEEIEEQVAESTCACSDADSVARGLAEFARSFPDSAAAGAASERARAARENRSKIRLDCVSG